MGTKEYHRAYYEANKDKWKEYHADRKRHNELARESYHRTNANLRKRQWTQDNYEWALWYSTKQRAKADGIPWDLLLEDIVIPETCPYLGIPLTRLRGKGQVMSNASVDRIDNTKGYTKDNIQIISRQANAMKRDVSIEELICFANNILERHAN